MLKWPFVLSAILWSACGWTQQSEPQAFANSYLAAMSKYDARAMAAGMHPAALAQFRSSILPIFESGSNTRASAEALPLFEGVKSVSELKSLSPEAFYAAFLAGIAKANPRFADLMRGSRHEVLGHVVEKDDAHVVYRLIVTVEGNKVSRVTVLSLKRNGNGWGALLTAEAEGMAASLKRRYQ